MLTRRKALIGSLLAGTSWGAFEWYLTRDAVLSERPAHVTSTLKLPMRDSVIAASATIPLSAVEAEINRTVPSRIEMAGNGPDVGGTINPGGLNVIRVPVYAGTKYDAVIERGAIAMAGTGKTFTISAPLKLSGHGGFRGDGARLLKLDAKAFRAEGILSATVTLDLDEKWCPVVSVTPSLAWRDSPQVEIASRAWVGVEGITAGSVKKMLDDAAQAIARSLPCGIVQAEVKKLWTTRTLRVTPADMPALHANITPRAVSFTGLDVRNGVLHVGVRLVATTEVATMAMPPRNLGELPKLERHAHGPGQLALAVPVRVGYAALDQVLAREVVGKPVKITVDGHAVTVAPSRVEVYSTTGNRIAVGVTFSARTPWHVLDTTGKIWLTAALVTERNGAVIRLDQPQLARQVDNRLVALATALFDSHLKEAIGRHARIDLASLIAQQTAALQSEIEKLNAKGEVRLSVGKITAGLGAIVTEAETITGLVNLDVAIDATVVRLSQSGSRTIR